jgi:hypothetical protein
VISRQYREIKTQQFRGCFHDCHQILLVKLKKPHPQLEMVSIEFVKLPPDVVVVLDACHPLTGEALSGCLTHPSTIFTY